MEYNLFYTLSIVNIYVKFCYIQIWYTQTATTQRILLDIHAIYLCLMCLSFYIIMFSFAIIDICMFHILKFAFALIFVMYSMLYFNTQFSHFPHIPYID